MMVLENAKMENTRATGMLEAVTFEAGTKLADIERVVILETLKQKNFNRTHTARALGIGIRTLQRKLKRYSVAPWNVSHPNAS